MSIIYIALFLSAHCYFYLANSEFICPNKNGLYSHPTDCQAFYNCWNGIAYLQKCNEDLFFNPELQLCDYQKNVKCEPVKRSVCEKDQPLVLVKENGRIWSPKNDFGRYDPNSRCSWLIIAPLGQTVSLTFQTLDLENSQDCNKDKIELYEGTCASDKLLKTICGTTADLPTVVTNGSKLFVRFVSDHENEFEGFSAQYTFNQRRKTNGNSAEVIADNTKACNENRSVILENMSGMITSPGFNISDMLTGSKYPPNSICEWIMKAPKKHVIQIDFAFFELQSSFRCGLDALVINDTTLDKPKITVLCRSELPKRLISLGNELKLFFASDGFRQFAGFLLHYTVIPESMRCNSSELQCGRQKCVKNSWRCDGFDDCSDGTDERQCVSSYNETPQCGIPKNTVQKRVVGGQQSKLGQWPWQAALFDGNGRLGTFRCGGTIIDRNWILTAAHCFKYTNKAEDWAIAVGKTDVYSSESTEQWRAVREIVMHPGFSFERTNESSVHGANDIALLHLQRPLEFTGFVIPACLPAVGSELITEGRLLNITGYGHTYGTGIEGTLREAEVPIRSEEDCRNIYPKHYPQKDNDIMFCAAWKTGGHDSCQGDSGGPAVTKVSDHWVLAGVISWGDGCGEVNKAGVYTKVSYFIPWIEDVTKLSFSTKFVVDYII